MFTTEEIMEIALDMIGINFIPGDSAIYNPGKNIKKVLMGIDMEAPEIIMAKNLGYDAVIAHHPTGALLTFHEVLEEHVKQMKKYGVPEDEARKAIKDIKFNYELLAQRINYDHAPSVAKLLDMPYLNIHYPLDQLGKMRMEKAIAENTDEKSTVSDVIDALYTLPEVREAQTEVKLQLGQANNKAGKVVVSHGAGTNGGYNVASTYFKHGVDTVIYIHIKAADLMKLRQENEGNLIVVGHLTGDILGINPFIRELEERGLIVDRISGL